MSWKAGVAMSMLVCDMNDPITGTARRNSNDCEITISREFDAPRELVFSAWTDAKHVARWWGPRGFVNEGCEMDLRVGGAISVLMRGPDGVLYPAKGIFREIVKPERIVYEGEMHDAPGCGAGLPPRATVTVTFEAVGQKTLLSIHTVMISAAEKAAAVCGGFEMGWSDSLDRLEEFLVV